MIYRTRSTDMPDPNQKPPDSDGTAYEPADDKPCVLCCSRWFGLVVVAGVVLWAIFLGWWILG